MKEKEQAELRLREREPRDRLVLQDEFFAMLAHALRNPLTPISTAAQLLKGFSSPDGETVSWAANMIESQVTHLARLIDDLLDVSHIARGTMPLQKQAMDLNAIVSLAVQACRPSITRRNQQLSVSLPEKPIWLLGDSARLSQVLQNLLLNAAHCTPMDGRIEIGTRHGEKGALVYVRDNGIGVRVEDMEGIFEPFAQTSPRGNTQQSGLGLTLAKSLVELHGGKINAFSAGEGKGSEFVVTLPVLVGHQ